MSQHNITVTYAMDYETYYDKICSVIELGNWAYTHHPQFSAYLLSVVGTNGFEWVGSPKDFDWQRFEGARLVAHNAGFELAVTEFLRDLGIVPKNLRWAEFFDTADMAAYLRCPRSLAEAMVHLLGRKIDKGMRDKAKGKKWEEMTPEFQAAMSAYCLQDSRDELELYVTHGDKWPEDERELARATRDMCWAGVTCDVPGTASAIELLSNRLADVRKEIPWPDPPLGSKNVKAHCAKHNIDPPITMAKDSPMFEAWVDRHGDKHPWAKAMGAYRSINMLYKKVLTMKERTDANGIFRYGMKYFGGHLGRDSGDTGFNPQNLSRKPMHGVYLRNLMIKAPPGKIIGIADEGQIEPRVLACISGDTEKVKLMKEGMDVYEIQARIDNEYNDPRPMKEVDKDGRQYNKVKVLACGYGAGPPKVQFIAHKEVGLELAIDQCEQLVYKFRQRRFIPNLWARLENDMRKSAKRGEDYEMELPSGRSILYRDAKNLGHLSGVIVKYAKLMRLSWWGGSLTENAVQAIARDIFMYHVLRIRRELGLPIILRSHDEVVTMLNEDTAEQDLKNQLAIMREPPPWMLDFPASADGALVPCYTKI